MKCVVNWIPLRIRVRSRHTQPTLSRVFAPRERRKNSKIYCELEAQHFQVLRSFESWVFLERTRILGGIQFTRGDRRGDGSKATKP